MLLPVYIYRQRANKDGEFQFQSEGEGYRIVGRAENYDLFKLHR